MAFRDDLIAVIPNLRAFAHSLCGSRDQADDLVQEALTKAWANQTSFAAGTNFKAWIFTILRNHYYSQFRKRSREVADTDGVLTGNLAVHPAQDGHIDLADMRSAMIKLSDEHREALTLVAVEGLSYEDAAAICECAVGTMKSRVNRARNRLSELLVLSDAAKYGPEGHVASIIASKGSVAPKVA